MSTTGRSKLYKFCLTSLHTLCTLGITVMPFILESVYKQELSPLRGSNVSLKIMYLLLSVISLFLYYLASFKDPGFAPLPKYSSACENSEDENDDDDYGVDRSSQDLNLLEKGLKLRHCGFCGIKQPLRAKHCESCSRCVRRFDHHCPWLGNCVGEGNHRYFILFLIFSSVGLVCSVFMVWNSKSHNEDNHTLSHHTDNLRWLCIAALLFLCVPLVALSLVHLYLTFFNLTTWEFMSRHRISYLRDLEDLDLNPFHLGCCWNGFVMFCSRSYENWEKIYARRFLDNGGYKKKETLLE